MAETNRNLCCLYNKRSLHRKVLVRVQCLKDVTPASPHNPVFLTERQYCSSNHQIRLQSRNMRKGPLWPLASTPSFFYFVNIFIDFFSSSAAFLLLSRKQKLLQTICLPEAQSTSFCLGLIARSLSGHLWLHERAGKQGTGLSWLA